MEKRRRLVRVSSACKIRLDNYIKNAASLTRQEAQAMIEAGGVSVNGAVQVKCHKSVKNGDNVEFEEVVKRKREVQGFDGVLDILHSGEGFAAVNKPAGMITHPTKHAERDTLLNAAVAKFKKRGIHIINRLDKETSGIVLLAFDRKTAAELYFLVKSRQVYKEYACVVHGDVNKPGRICAEISGGGGGAKRRTAGEGGKEAVSFYEPVAGNGKITLLKVVIKTGRTHQIRAHMGYIGHPIAGDRSYGDAKKDEELFKDSEMPAGQLLHASKMEFVHRDNRVVISSALPGKFLTLQQAGAGKN